MNRAYIEKRIRSGKWIADTLPSGLKMYWAERSSNFVELFESEEEDSEDEEKPDQPDDDEEEDF